MRMVQLIADNHAERLFLDGFHEPQWDGGLIENLVCE
jgi:hypothetical protein